MDGLANGIRGVNRRLTSKYDATTANVSAATPKIWIGNSGIPPPPALVVVQLVVVKKAVVVA